MPVQEVNLVLMVPVMGKLMLNSKMPGRHLRHKTYDISETDAARIIKFDTDMVQHGPNYNMQFVFGVVSCQPK